MKDIHKKFAKRSMKDAAYLQEEVAEEYDIEIPSQFIGQFALAMYQHRVENWRMKKMEAKQEAQAAELEPDGDGNIGRF